MTGIIACPICDSLILTHRNEFNCRNCGSIISEDWRGELIIKKLGSVPLKELTHVMALRMIPEEEILIRILEYFSEHPGSTINDVSRALGVDTPACALHMPINKFQVIEGQKNQSPT